ncbi:hypothetical protein D9601_07825 [Sphingomonas sp. MA1305]|uniref:recombinase family protein n=1 Tax=Sphingomonas sp. MA1305 TaxID=2479204 RepID=UPI0018DF4920|nr:hypothetical protein [Sphingomonas sp. MA1305]
MGGGPGGEGRKIIDVDPENGPIIARLFERCSTGAYTLRELRDIAQEAGLRYRRSGKPVGISTIHYILRNRIYSGHFEWNGQLCHGSHMPLVPAETWEMVRRYSTGEGCRMSGPTRTSSPSPAWSPAVIAAAP